MVTDARANEAAAVRCSTLGLGLAAGFGEGAGVCEKAVTPRQLIANNKTSTLFVRCSPLSKWKECGYLPADGHYAIPSFRCASILRLELAPAIVALESISLECTSVMAAMLSTPVIQNHCQKIQVSESV